MTGSYRKSGTPTVGAAVAALASLPPAACSSTSGARWVAAPERPDIAYKFPILNSPAVNAFALPSGQLYVTRGLLGLANDSAEFASVMSHEMAHVTARHAAMREEQARKTELISNVNDMLSDPQVGAMALARSKLALAS